jgi:hypothetical protein
MPHASEERVLMRHDRVSAHLQLNMQGTRHRKKDK